MLKGTPIETGYYRFLQRYMVPKLIQLKLEPNHITIIGLITSVIAGISFAFSPFAGGLLTWLTGLLDTLDGSVARTTGQEKQFGAFLDSVLDRYTELVIYLGIWFYFYREGYSGPLLSVVVLLMLFGSLMVSYTRARAEGLGQRCLVGLLQRGERIILIGLAGVLNPFVNRLLWTPDSRWLQDITLLVTLLILVIGTNFTALWRFLHVLNNLRRR